MELPQPHPYEWNWTIDHSQFLTDIETSYKDSNEVGEPVGVKIGKPLELLKLDPHQQTSGNLMLMLHGTMSREEEASQMADFSTSLGCMR